ncbi:MULTISPECIES: hypothetical protein [Parabacteroides]|uniref:hypothetical protein n=1 Tax=Parabacteroides provencensis TaxID=1944636 RepID=UPI001E38985F|nr:hypothetical protein [Parabacteroides provencensis]
MQQKINNKQTPLEKLISDKERIRKQCKEHEQKLNEDFSYIQENAGSLLLSGVSSLLFPKTRSAAKSGENTTTQNDNGDLPAVPLGFSDYLSITKSMLPLAWDIAQPFIMTWGIKKAKNLLRSVFSKKKK